MRSNHFLLSAVLILSLAAAFPASASVPENSTIDSSIVAPLMDWVAKETGTRVSDMPQVVASRSLLAAALKHGGTLAMGRPRSGYIPGMVIVDNVYWDSEDSTQISLLVHELVHHAQHSMTRARWECPDAREEQAYLLQNKWLEDHGHAPFVSTAWIQRVSGCRDTTPQRPAVADNDGVTPNG